MPDIVPVPPVAETVTVDDPPLQSMAVDDAVATTAVGVPTVEEVPAVQPAPSMAEIV